MLGFHFLSDFSRFDVGSPQFKWNIQPEVCRLSKSLQWPSKLHMAWPLPPPCLFCRLVCPHLLWPPCCTFTHCVTVTGSLHVIFSPIFYIDSPFASLKTLPEWLHVTEAFAHLTSPTAPALPAVPTVPYPQDRSLSVGLLFIVCLLPQQWKYREGRAFVTVYLCSHRTWKSSWNILDI